MSYRKAEEVLPFELINEIQKYISGECLYIPAKFAKKSDWGIKSGYRQELDTRNGDIFAEYLKGLNIAELAEKYFLSEKSIYRIIIQMKLLK
jgi:Mor family transcriptional regulator